MRGSQVEVFRLQYFMFEVSITLPGPGCEPLTGTDGTGVAGDRSWALDWALWELGGLGDSGGGCRETWLLSAKVSISARVCVG